MIASSQVVHVRENSDENSIAILDEKAGDWTITNVQRIYQTAVQLLSEYKTRPRIVEVNYKCCHLSTFLIRDGSLPSPSLFSRPSLRSKPP